MIMIKLLNNVVTSFKKIDQFSVAVIYHGLQLACGLYLLSALFYLIAGHYGDYFSVLNCAKGAYEAAPTVAAATFTAALISDIAIKDRKSNSNT